MQRAYLDGLSKRCHFCFLVFFSGLRGVAWVSLAKDALVLCAILFAFVSWATARSTLVSMLLVATSGAAQFFPGVLLTFFDRRPSASGIAAGLIGSLLFLCWTTTVRLPVIVGVNVGLVAMALNFAVVGSVSLAGLTFRSRTRRGFPK